MATDDLTTRICLQGTRIGLIAHYRPVADVWASLDVLQTLRGWTFQCCGATLVGVADRSAIEWTEATWNPVTGCSKVSPGCAHCYAEAISLRFRHSSKPWTPENARENVRLHDERLDQPLRWRRPRLVFVNSMSDLFHEQVPATFIDRVWRVMTQASQHTFQVLTKRPEQARDWAREYVRMHGSLGHNVWLGVSIENSRYTSRADVLREIPAA